MTNTRRLDILFRNAVDIGLRDLVLTATFLGAERRYTGTYGGYPVDVSMSLGFKRDWLRIMHCTDTEIPIAVLGYQPGSSVLALQVSDLRPYL